MKPWTMKQFSLTKLEVRSLQVDVKGPVENFREESTLFLFW